MIGVPYFRFNPQMSVDLPMDEKMDAPVSGCNLFYCTFNLIQLFIRQLINMMWETKAYMFQNRNKVIEMINLLK